jgi:sulfur relay (sulfurtransferase) complex TusBCD TusD component (DsrE family)
MAELTLGVFPSLVGSMSLDFSFKLAEAAMAKGHKVNLWLSGNAVMMAKKGQKAFKDY